MTALIESRSKLAFHDAEHGGYRADLPLWLELAAAAEGPILDLGAGTGRVAVALAQAGHELIAVDSDAELLAEAERRALGARGAVSTIVADARELALGSGAERVALAIAPMQFFHLLGGPGGRSALLERLTAILRPGGLLAAAILDEGGVVATGPADRALPDIREVDGYVHTSLPLGIRADSEAIHVDRLRQIVNPAGELSEDLHTIALDHLDAATLEAEAAPFGFTPSGRLPVAETDEHVGSLCVLLEASRG